MNWYKKAKYNITKEAALMEDIKKRLKYLGLIGLTAYIGAIGIATMDRIIKENPGNPVAIKNKIINEVNNQDIDINQPSSEIVPEMAPEVTPEIQKETIPSLYNIDNLKETLKRHEGIRRKSYRDTKDNVTIGIGFNLENPIAIKLIGNMGLNFKNIYDGKVLLNDEQIYELFDYSLNIAINDAKNFVGTKNFYQHPAKVQEIIINMAFNLGYNKLLGFEEFQNALLNFDYKRAAAEMVDSEWFKQVKNRSKELVNIMETLE